MTKKIKQQQGFMMVEVLISVSIVALTVLSATLVTQKVISISNQSLHTVQAGFLLEEGAEAMRVLRDNDWNNIVPPIAPATYYLSFSGGTWTKGSTPVTDGIFTRTVTISSVNRDASTQDIVTQGGVADNGTFLIQVTVSWSESGTAVSKSMSFYLSNIFS